MVTHFFEARGGGIEVVAGQLARHLAPMGYGLTWCATGPAPAIAGSVRLVSLPATSVLERFLGIPMPVPHLTGLRTIARLARESDAVMIHDALYPTSVTAFISARWHRKPILLVQHVGAVPYRSTLLRFAMRAGNWFVCRALLSWAEQVLFISETTRSHFGTIAYRRPPAIVFNGVDGDGFRPPESMSEKEACRARFSLPATGPILLFVGRFVEKKGLKFVKQLAREHRSLTFVLAGSGQEEPRRWALSNVIVAGPLPASALAQLYRAGDLLLLPSVGEGFPLVIQEALASGLPVVCGRDSAEADPFAAPYLNGVAIDPDDVPGTVARLSEAIRGALQYDSPAGRVSERAAFARARYSWPAAAERYNAVLSELIESRRT